MHDQIITTFLHQPLGSASGSTDAHRLDTLRPTHVDFAGTLNLMAVWVHASAFVEEHLAV